MSKLSPDALPGFSFSILTSILRNSVRLTKMVWKDKPVLVVLLLGLSILVSLLPFLNSGSIGLLVNELGETTLTHTVNSTLYFFSFLFIISIFVPPFLYAIQGYVDKLFTFYLSELLEMLIIKHKAKLDIAVQEDPSWNNLLSKIRENGIWRVQNFIDRQLYILQGGVAVFVASAILFFSNAWVLAAVILGTIPLLVFEAKYGETVWNIHTGKAETKRKFWALRGHFEIIPSLIELRLFQNVEHFIGRIHELFKIFQNEERLNERRKIVWEIFSVLVAYGTMTVCMVWFLRQTISGEIKVGTFTFIAASIGTFGNSLQALFRNFGRQYQDGLFVADVFKLIDAKPVIIETSNAVQLPNNATPEIVFENVGFKYPGSSTYAIKNISLRISPGEKVAFVGANGAGKTTFVKLLCRFYDPTEGRITVGGMDLKDIKLSSWYAKLGILFQDYANYDLVAREVISIGNTKIPETMESVREAARASEANIFIEEWDKSYDQMIGKQFSDGVEPSIGQRQKLALARTFYRDPRVFVLDEPTSSIDAEAEAKIFDRLERLADDRTVLLISHRFGTVRQADRIYVMGDKTIIESGTHKSLLRKKGVYARLFALQAKGYE